MKDSLLPRKILLADDSVTAQNMGRKILADAGYEVTTVNNGAAALKKVAERKPDLIVLDVYMPGYSGLEVCQRLKESRETQRIPILLTVGKLEPFKADEARRVRADAYIVKPFEASELLTALTKLEDKIVPEAEPRKPGRFAKAVAAVEPPADQEYGDSESGWKNRIKFPTGKKKAEPEPELPASEVAQIRERAAEAAKAVPPANDSHGSFARPVPNGIPSDVTPEEIAAITAAAAQLNAAAGATTEIDSTPHQAETAAQASSVEVHSEREEVSSQPAATVEAVAAESAAAESAASPQPEVQSEVHAEAQPAQQAEAQSESTDEEAGGVTFASAPNLAEPEAKQEPVTAEPVAAEPVPAPAAEAVVAEAPAEVVQEAAVAEAPAEEVAPAPAAEVAATPILPASEPETPAAEAPKPESAPAAAAAERTPEPDADVIAALAALGSPSNGNGAHASAEETKPAIENEVPAAVAAMVASAEMVPAGPRWIAEAVALEANEASMILEREMEKAYAATAAVAGYSSVDQAPAAETMSSSIPAAEPANQMLDSTEAAAHSDESTAHQVDQALAAAVGGGSDSHAVSALSHAAEAEEDTRTDADANAATAAAWANWRQIRESIMGSPIAAQVAEVAAAEMQQSSTTEPASDSAKAEPATGEAESIASIVDSVLAELKPKLVEEIARKLKK